MNLVFSFDSIYQQCIDQKGLDYQWCHYRKWYAMIALADKVSEFFAKESNV